MGWRLFLLSLLCLMMMVDPAQGKRDVEAEKSPEYWKKVAQTELVEALEKQALNTNVAKNVIIFLGDGMGISTITAGRILKGQMRNESGEETKLAMEKFPHTALSKTYSVDKQVADSASTATAYLCGVKSNYYTLGLNAAAELKNCKSAKGNEVNSVLVDSYNEGKSTGIVTTTKITHATPGGAYAHTPYRKWYSDADLSDDAKENGCKDMGEQFYESSHMITVVLAGGRKDLRPNTTTDYEHTSKKNKRKDGKDLIEMWKTKMSSDGFNSAFVWNKTAFDNVDVASTDRLLGLFEPSNMNYEAERSRDVAGEPSLAEMTEKAIQMLQKNDKGYFLLVEGGRIDHAHHAGDAYLSLHDVVAFDDAIERAVEMTSESETLIIATADHSHVFTMGGYADRGSNIFGLAPSNDDPEEAVDNKPYTTLLYGNGPGYKGYWAKNEVGYNSPVISNETMERVNPANVDTTAPDYLQQTAVPLASETHGGEDVAIFAKGPMAHLFHGVHEQNYIAYVMRYVSCVGEDKDHCQGNSDVTNVVYFGNNMSSASAMSALYVQTILCIVLGIIILILLVFIIKNRENLRPPSREKKRTQDNEMPLTGGV